MFVPLTGWIQRLASGVAVAVLAAGVLLPAAALADKPSGFDPPKKYYLALGDSLAYGWQLNKVIAEQQAGHFDPATFNTGYVDDFARLMAPLRLRQQVVNYSCSGESTSSFLTGACPWHGPNATSGNLPLHTDWAPATNQHDATIAFLRAHPGRVSPITLNLGGNDLGILYFGVCHLDVTCTINGFPAVLATVTKNLDQILTDLRVAAPRTEIILLSYYDPFVSAIPQSVPLYRALNAAEAQVATAHGVRVADDSSSFTASTICTLTFVCQAPLHDLHPTDAGYHVEAQALWAASGYAKLEQEQQGQQELQGEEP